MRNRPWLLTLLLMACAGADGPVSTQPVELPDPVLAGELSLEGAISVRRSVRSYSGESLTLREVSQILWAAQGVTDAASGYRAAPSAGALYPLETYLIAWNVEGLEPGVYRYLPSSHSLEPHAAPVSPEDLMSASLDQSWVSACPATMLLSAVFERTGTYYGERGIGYVYMEAGHVSQNVYLQCAALGLGTVSVGAFRDEEVAGLAGLPEEAAPLCLMPLGRPR